MSQSVERFSVDAHVHLHPGFDLGRCLSAAADHMAPVWGEARAGCLMLTEIAGRDTFPALPDRAGDWTLAPTAERTSRLARRSDGAWLAVTAGRQIVTAEGLEILALGMVATPSDGRPLEATLAAVREASALAVLPWGVGKWTGARGGIVDALVEREAGARDIFLADSGVRPGRLARPARLVRAEAAGWRVLAGTDPLPLPGEEEKPGRFGFLLEGAPDPERPFAALSARLKALDRSPETYGRLESVPRFLRQQIAMQLRKRLG